MTFYSNLEATARRLIAQFGKSGAIFRESRSGPPHDPVVSATEYACVLVETGYSLTNRDVSLIEAGAKVGLISTSVAISVEKSDKIRIDGELYNFFDLSPLNPGGTVLLYEFVAKK